MESSIFLLHFVSDNCNANRNNLTRIGTHWSNRVSATDSAADSFTDAQ
jgi:hypothetical protein